MFMHMKSSQYIMNYWKVRGFLIANENHEYKFLIKFEKYIPLKRIDNCNIAYNEVIVTLCGYLIFVARFLNFLPSFKTDFLIHIWNIISKIHSIWVSAFNIWWLGIIFVFALKNKLMTNTLNKQKVNTIIEIFILSKARLQYFLVNLKKLKVYIFISLNNILYN